MSDAVFGSLTYSAVINTRQKDAGLIAYIGLAVPQKRGTTGLCKPRRAQAASLQAEQQSHSTAIMASQKLKPQSLEVWEEPFQCSVPVDRWLEPRLSCDDAGSTSMPRTFICVLASVIGTLD